jgi:hypothetical protein
MVCASARSGMVLGWSLSGFAWAFVGWPRTGWSGPGMALAWVKLASACLGCPGSVLAQPIQEEWPARPRRFQGEARPRRMPDPARTWRLSAPDRLRRMPVRPRRIYGKTWASHGALAALQARPRPIPCPAWPRLMSAPPARPWRMPDPVQATEHDQLGQ